MLRGAVFDEPVVLECEKNEEFTLQG